MTAQDTLAASRTEPFQLGDRTIFPQRNRILGPAGEVHLEPKVMDVICVLAAQAGEVISRESLIDRVWTLKYGSDESLTRAVSILRKALGAGVIETIAKRGYRLTTPVEAVTIVVEPARPPLPVAQTASQPAEPPAAQPAVAEAKPRPSQSHALRQLGRGPNGIFPVASLDFWRLPPIAFAVALALALGIGAADAGLAWP